MSKEMTADPRIAPKEMIITRTKSAQQRRQLREKDRSMTKITQLLKPQSPKTYKNIKKKKLKPTEKKGGNTETITNKSNQEEFNKEYYPDKLRRKFEEKKNFLKPKYKSKAVVKLNKRKSETPQRGLLPNETPQSDNISNWSYVYDSKSHILDQLSMEEMVRIVEETESLDDEDLMEILTCPSPVWWEDPPDENYIEEPLYRRIPGEPKNHPVTSSNKSLLKQKRKDALKNNTKKSSKNDKTFSPTNLITITKTDESFLRKRNKLENLLGNIKNKSAIEPINVVKKDLHANIIENNVDTSSELEKVTNKKEKRDSESNESFPDFYFNNDDMLKDLENMDIPIELNYKEELECQSPEVGVSVNKPNIISETHTKNDDSLSIEKPYEQADTVASDVPINLPRLTKRPKLQESPSVKSISEETVISNSSGQENMDTISDTNIRFINDDDVEIVGHNNLFETIEIKSENIECKRDENIQIVRDENSPHTKETKSENVNDGKERRKEAVKAQTDKKEFITIYKIVANESLLSKFKNIPEYSNYVDNLKDEENANEENKCNGQLNSFFKKCKFANRKKRKEVEAQDSEAKASFCDTCEPKKCITVAQEENMKYCMNCSAIFDTDECSYCLKSSKCCARDPGEPGSES